MKRILFAVLLLATPAMAQDAPFDWKFQPAVGSKWQIRSDSTIRTAVLAPYQPSKTSPVSGLLQVDSNLRIYYLIDYEVLSKDVGGAYSVRYTFRSVNLAATASAHGSAMKRPLKNVTLLDLQSFPEIIENRTLTLKWSPQGELWNIVGADALVKQMNAEWRNLSQISLTPAAAVFGGFRTQTGLKAYFTATMRRPNYPLFPGQTFTYSNGLPKSPNVDVDTDGSMTLTSRANGRASFNIGEHYDANYASPQGQPRGIKQDLHYSADGTLSVDEKTGLRFNIEATERTQSTSQIYTNGDQPTMTTHVWVFAQSRTVIAPGQIPTSDAALGL